MQPILQRFLVCLAVLAGLTVPRPAAAQDERGNVALGYNYGYLFSPNGGPGLSLPTGVFLSAGEWTGRGTLLVGELAEGADGLIVRESEVPAEVLRPAADAVRACRAGNQ